MEVKNVTIFLKEKNQIIGNMILHVSSTTVVTLVAKINQDSLSMTF